ncbi:thioredoxin reductase (NADPH) [Lachnospiraceae bacterium NE2001]|nr:thioredoxin reductase (NADPH) [Lachnospiraceae bacterium NE2001]
MYDIIVVGGGPAGLTAAIYGLRNGKSVFVIEKSVFGGQIVNSPKVENIPGFDSISGDDFGDKLLEQAMGQGAEVTLENVTSIENLPIENVEGVTNPEEGFVVKTEEGDSYEGRTVILATGTTHRTLGLPGEEDLIGNGISFCAVCDGDFYRDKTVVMIGGGNSAFVESSLLVDIVGHLTILQDMPFFTADQKLQDQVLSGGEGKAEVETHVGTKILAYETEDADFGKKITGVRYEEAGAEKVAKCDGVFLAVGLVPENEAFGSLADLDERGYFVPENIVGTKTPGIFVAGDCCAKTLRQVATACSDGAYAAIAACDYLKK